jgi:hypothetical protein
MKYPISILLASSIGVFATDIIPNPSLVGNVGNSSNYFNGVYGTNFYGSNFFGLQFSGNAASATVASALSASAPYTTTNSVAFQIANSNLLNQAQVDARALLVTNGFTGIVTRPVTDLVTTNQFVSAATVGLQITSSNFQFKALTPTTNQFVDAATVASQLISSNFQLVALAATTNQFISAATAGLQVGSSNFQFAALTPTTNQFVAALAVAQQISTNKLLTGMTNASGQSLGTAAFTATTAYDAAGAATLVTNGFGNIVTHSATELVTTNQFTTTNSVAFQIANSNLLSATGSGAGLTGITSNSLVSINPTQIYPPISGGGVSYADLTAGTNSVKVYSDANLTSGTNAVKAYADTIVTSGTNAVKVFTQNAVANVLTNLSTGVIVTNNALQPFSVNVNTNTYTGLYVQNFSNGTNASAELGVIADNGSPVNNGFFMGINSSTMYNSAIPPTGTNLAYLIALGNVGNTNNVAQTVNLEIATAQTNSQIIISTGNGMLSTNATISTTGIQLLIGQFIGNGQGLTSIQGPSISGTLNDSSLGSAALTNRIQTFTAGTNTFQSIVATNHYGNASGLTNVLVTGITLASPIVTNSGAQTFTGVQTFSSAPVLSGASITAATVPYAALPIWPQTNFTKSAYTNLVTAHIPTNNAPTLWVTNTIVAGAAVNTGPAQRFQVTFSYNTTAAINVFCVWSNANGAGMAITNTVSTTANQTNTITSPILGPNSKFWIINATTVIPGSSIISLL